MPAKRKTRTKSASKAVKTSSYEVKGGIPIPKIPRKPRAEKYPWKSLKVGDSFFVPNMTRTDMASSMYPAMRRNKIKCKTAEDTVRGAIRPIVGVRVWRVASLALLAGITLFGSIGCQSAPQPISELEQMIQARMQTMLRTQPTQPQ